MKSFAWDVVAGVALAMLIAALMLFVSFDSSFIYQRF